MKYRFASCCLDTSRCVFETAGRAVHLEPQVFEFLVCLCESGGELVTRETLLARVWKGAHVSDAAVSARVSAARRAVGDSGKAQGVIETVACRGFRLVAPVTTEAPIQVSRPQAAPALAPASLPILAVLPFRCQPDGPLETLAGALMDELTATLSRVGEFHVIAWQSTVSFRDPLDARSAAQILGADYLLDGSIRCAGDRVRIAVNLLNAQGHMIWSSRFDEMLGDLFALQDSIAMQVTGQLPGRLRGAEIFRARTLPGEPVKARAWVLRAMPNFWAHERAANDHAIDLLSRALEADGTDARALAFKAWALAQRPAYLWSQDASADRLEARALATRAIPRANDDPAALVAISAALGLVLSDPLPSLAFARRALEIDPNNAWGRMRLGWALNYTGQPGKALAEFDHAQRLSPLDPFLYNMRIGAAIAHVGLGNFDRAIVLVRDVIAVMPHLSWAYRILASIFRHLGDGVGEADATGRLLEANPGLTVTQLEDALPPGMAGRNPPYISWQLLDDT